jgi:hypothetical protein
VQSIVLRERSRTYVHSASKIPALVLMRLGCFALAAAGILAVLRIVFGG